MKVESLFKEGYTLFHQGAIALSQVEENGIRIDLTRLAKTKDELVEKIRLIRLDLKSGKVWKAWKKRYGELEANLMSRDQLAQVLGDLDYSLPGRTATGKVTADEEALQKLGSPFVDKYLRMAKYEKAHRTYLKGIEKLVINGRIHPDFDLHTVKTMRGSSSNPNFQNYPVRDKEITKIIRRLFIASSLKHVLVENDFKGIEVSVSACYHKDKNFISYITTPGKDMHRDMAAQIYCLKPEEVSKDARYGAKNKFVFPQFYGDYYVACARNLWDWISKGKLTGPKGIPLQEHLAEFGIKSLGACDPEQTPKKGTFELHIQEVENDFWNNRFMQYGKWRKDFYYAYVDKGYFDMYTGFRVHGTFSRNQVTNAPVQGSAFHCLLWTLIQVQKQLVKYKMKSKIVGQIHDSLVGDVLIKELRDYLEIVEETATVRLREHYKWLIVPLEIEYEICPSTGSWYDKKETKFKKGIFTHPTNPNKKTADPEKFIHALNKQHENDTR